MFLPNVHSRADPLQGLPAAIACADGVWSTPALLDHEALWHPYSCSTTLESGSDGDVDWRRFPHDDAESQLPEDVYHLVD